MRPSRGRDRAGSCGPDRRGGPHGAPRQAGAAGGGNCRPPQAAVHACQARRRSGKPAEPGSRGSGNGEGRRGTLAHQGGIGALAGQGTIEGRTVDAENRSNLDQLRKLLSCDLVPAFHYPYEISSIISAIARPVSFSGNIRVTACPISAVWRCPMPTVRRRRSPGSPPAACRSVPFGVPRNVARRHQEGVPRFFHRRTRRTPLAVCFSLLLGIFLWAYWKPEPQKGSAIHFRTPR